MMIKYLECVKNEGSLGNKKNSTTMSSFYRCSYRRFATTQVQSWIRVCHRSTFVRINVVCYSIGSCSQHCHICLRYLICIFVIHKFLIFSSSPFQSRKKRVSSETGWCENVHENEASTEPFTNKSHKVVWLLMAYSKMFWRGESRVLSSG